MHLCLLDLSHGLKPSRRLLEGHAQHLDLPLAGRASDGRLLGLQPVQQIEPVSFLLGFFHHQLRSSLLLAASMGAGRRSISPEVVGCCLRALASTRAKKLGSSPVSDTEFIGSPEVCGRRPTEEREERRVGAE